MTSSQQYIDITLVPSTAGHKGGRSLWVHHIIPVHPSPVLARKWDYIVKRSRIWYEDSDGDNITLGSSSELIEAVNELVRERHFVRFQFKMQNFVDDELLFKFMDELDKVKIRYRILGSESVRGSIELDKDTREIKDKSSYRIAEERALFEEEARKPEEEVDPLVFEEDEKSVKIGDNVQVGENVDIEETRMNVDIDYEKSFDSVPEHDDIVYTPEEWSPAPSPRLEPFANSDMPLIELPCVPIHISLPPPKIIQDDAADDPPDSPPSESLFPAFPGTFPVEPNDTPNRQYSDFQVGISAAIQTTLDALARLGHLTVTGAQNTGFPVANANSFDNARRTIDTNAQTVRRNLESVRMNLQSNLEQARMRLQASIASATTNIDSARTGLNSGLTTVLSNTSTALTNATRQIEQATRSAAMSVQQSGAVSPDRADRIIQDLRTAGERVERAVEEMTIRIQRRIDQHALSHQPEHPVSEREVEDEDDIYGPPAPPTSLPGSFPVERSKVEECIDQLIEMGFFNEEQRDTAGAVSVAAEGDITNAIEIVQGTY